MILLGKSLSPFRFVPDVRDRAAVFIAIEVICLSLFIDFEGEGCDKAFSSAEVPFWTIPNQFPHVLRKKCIRSRRRIRRQSSAESAWKTIALMLRQYQPSATSRQFLPRSSPCSQFQKCWGLTPNSLLPARAPRAFFSENNLDCIDCVTNSIRIALYVFTSNALRTSLWRAALYILVTLGFNLHCVAIRMRFTIAINHYLLCRGLLTCSVS